MSKYPHKLIAMLALLLCIVMAPQANAQRRAASVGEFSLTATTVVKQVSDEDLFGNTEFGIEGASNSYQVGDLIELSIDEKVDKTDIISSDYVWTIIPKTDHKIWPDKSKILFGTGPTDTKYTVILNASYVFGEQDPTGAVENITQKSSSVVAEITVGKADTPNVPAQPTDPIKPDNPQLPPNSELTGSSAKAYDWVKLVVSGSNYDKQQIKQDAEKLAKSFNTIADLIEAGELSDIADIFARVKESNDKQVSNRKAWLPWFTAASLYLQANYKSGTISTAEQFGQTWKEFAIGLTTAASAIK
ncbi:hypothetical protein N9045_00570 [bacterium]|nr:hypothetical protein [bacterium]